VILREEFIKEIDNLITKKMKKGFWAGLVSFILAKITHLLVTFAIGIWVVVVTDGDLSEGWYSFLRIIDSSILGIIYLIFVTRFIYLKITK
jgi:hydrogenase/urease accessory protein HupE